MIELVHHSQRNCAHKKIIRKHDTSLYYVRVGFSRENGNLMWAGEGANNCIVLEVGSDKYK